MPARKRQGRRQPISAPAGVILPRCWRKRPMGLKAIDLYEADYELLEAAKSEPRRICRAPANSASSGTIWSGEKVERKYDLIVMNPPFHQGRAADPGIGQAMIKAASSALKPGGRLLMVANRGLPYEQALKAGFKDVQELAQRRRLPGDFRPALSFTTAAWSSADRNAGRRRSSPAAVSGGRRACRSRLPCRSRNARRRPAPARCSCRAPASASTR